MSHSHIPRIAIRLSRSVRAVHSRSIESPCRLLPSRTHLASTHSLRAFTSSQCLLKKAGKANKAHARPDSAPPVADGSTTATDEAYDVSGLESQILKAIERLTHDLSQLRSGGRLNPGIIEGLKVHLGTGRDGKQTVKLGDIAQVVPKGRLLNVMLGEPDHVKPVTSAIQASEHSLAPQPPHSDSPLTIPVPIPPPTGESRRAALEAAQKASEVADNAVREARAAHNKKLRKFEKERAVLPDDLQKAKQSMEEVTKKGHGEVKRITESAKKVLENQ